MAVHRFCSRCRRSGAYPARCSGQNTVLAMACSVAQVPASFFAVVVPWKFPGSGSGHYLAVATGHLLLFGRCKPTLYLHPGLVRAGRIYAAIQMATIHAHAFYCWCGLGGGCFDRGWLVDRPVAEDCDGAADGEARSGMLRSF